MTAAEQRSAPPPYLEHVWGVRGGKTVMCNQCNRAWAFTPPEVAKGDHNRTMDAHLAEHAAVPVRRGR